MLMDEMYSSNPRTEDYMEGRGSLNLSQATGVLRVMHVCRLKKTISSTFFKHSE
jgi:hypothetical protein